MHAFTRFLCSHVSLKFVGEKFNLKAHSVTRLDETLKINRYCPSCILLYIFKYFYGAVSGTQYNIYCKKCETYDLFWILNNVFYKGLCFNNLFTFQFF